MRRVGLRPTLREQQDVTSRLDDYAETKRRREATTTTAHCKLDVRKDMFTAPPSGGTLCTCLMVSGRRSSRLWIATAMGDWEITHDDVDGDDKRRSEEERRTTMTVTRRRRSLSQNLNPRFRVGPRGIFCVILSFVCLAVSRQSLRGPGMGWTVECS